MTVVYNFQYDYSVFFRELRWQSCFSLILGETQGLRFLQSPALAL